MKKGWLLLFLILCCIAATAPVTAQENGIQFSLTEGVDSAEVKSAIESNVSRLLTEMNAAQKDERPLNLCAMGMNEQAMQSLMMLWNNGPFVCLDDEVVERCITTSSGYQVRNIPLLLRPKDDKNAEYQNAVICFDKAGSIDNFYFAIPDSLFSKDIRYRFDLTDSCSQFMLDYVEQYLTAYYKKDIQFLSQLFNREGVVFIGKGKKKKNGDVSLSYTKQSREEFINNLGRVFKRDYPIKMKVNEICVWRSVADPKCYGVSLHHGWTCRRYKDSGYFFLLWDFNVGLPPMLHIVAWQPDMIKGKPLPVEQVFSLNDFNL